MKRFILFIAALMLVAVFTVSFAETKTPSDSLTALTEAENEAATEPETESPGFTVSTVDVNGEPFTEAYFAENGTKVILLNLFEYWCGPCVGELPELRKLYETYRDQGFLILGAFSDEDTESTRKTVEALGITYPVVEASSELEQFSSMYVPTSVFLKPDGTVLSEQIIGARDYDEWEQLLLQYLN